MKIILSPAKRMQDEVYIGPKTKPVFEEETKTVLSVLQSLSVDDFARIHHCSLAIAKDGYEKAKNYTMQGKLPALYAFDGIQYTYMAAKVFTEKELNYLESHLFILSALYGVLRPFDGVNPYRLEMKDPLPIKEKKNLYDFWGDKLYKEVYKDDKIVLNLASLEYSKCISKYVKEDEQFIDVYFAQRDKNNKLVEKGVYAKMARGRMTRYLAERESDSLEDVLSFNELGFVYSREDSTPNRLVFISDIDKK